MKKKIVLVIVLLALLISGCVISEEYRTAPERDASFCVVDFSLQEGYTGKVYRCHDDEKNVTCWVFNGISCIPDWQLEPPR